MASVTSPPHRPWLFAALAAVTAVVYLASLPGGWVLDDYYLRGAREVVDHDGWKYLLEATATRPLTMWSFWLNERLAGDAPGWWRVVNIGLHLFNGTLLYQCLRRLMPARNAEWAAALFLLHPLASEPVFYVFQRGVLLMTAFCLLSLWLWLRGRFAWATVAFAVALLAKEECVAWPLFLGALHLAISRNSREWRWVGAMLALSAMAGLRVLYAVSVLAGTGAGKDAGMSAGAYLLAQGGSLVQYGMRLLMPLITGYPLTWSPDTGGARWLVVLGWLAVWVTGTWLLRYTFAKNAKIGWMLVGAGLLLAPSSSIFPAADTVAWHRMYLPLVALAVAWGWWPWKSAYWRGVPLALCVMGLSWRTWIWADPQRVAREAARADSSFRAQVGYARTLPAAEALSYLDTAKWPQGRQLSGFHAERGRLLLELDRPAEALADFGEALALQPGDAKALTNRGVALAALGQREAAVRSLRQAVAADECAWEAAAGLRQLGEPIEIGPERQTRCRWNERQRAMFLR